MRNIHLSLRLFFWLLALPINTHADDLRIGTLLCLSGACSEWGHNSLQGAQLAVEELNASGGILGKKITMSVEDSGDAIIGARAISAYQALFNKGIKHFIGPSWDPAGLAIAPLAAKQDVIITSPSIASRKFSEAGQNLFKVSTDDSVFAKAIAKYARGQNWTKSAIITSQQSAESAGADVFEEEFRSLGGENILRLEPLPTVVDLRAEVMRIVKSNPDVVCLFNYNQMAIAAKRLKELGYRGPILAILIDDTVLNAAQGTLEGTIFASYPRSDAAFLGRYKARFNEAAGISSDTGYDTVMAYADAITKAKSFEPKDIARAMQDIEIEGASGQIRFDSGRSAVRAPQLYRISNGAKLNLEEN